MQTCDTWGHWGQCRVVTHGDAGDSAGLGCPTGQYSGVHLTTHAISQLFLSPSFVAVCSLSINPPQSHCNTRSCPLPRYPTSCSAGVSLTKWHLCCRTAENTQSTRLFFTVFTCQSIPGCRCTSPLAGTHRAGTAPRPGTCEHTCAMCFDNSLG